MRTQIQEGWRAVVEGRQSTRIRSGEADGKEWPPVGSRGGRPATITDPAVERDATSKTPAFNGE